MANQKTSLRFDHREIAVIFSLFIFVSLLMFTVGILVGKGLAQAKYEAILLSTEMGRTGRQAPSEEAPVAEAGEAAHRTGSSVSSGENELKKELKPVAAESKELADEQVDEPPPKPLQLVPKSSATSPPLRGLQEPKTVATDHLLKDPKIRALVEDEPATSKRPTLAAMAAVPSMGSSAPAKVGLPSSFGKGKFTVQVGSYPTEKDASERVETLRKLGFPYAYFSAKELGDQKETWYRVWLGYYPDFESAKRSGEILQQRGEVKNYLVRKTETAG